MAGNIFQNILNFEGVVMGTEKLWNFVPLISLLFLLPEILFFKSLPESVGFLKNKHKFAAIKKVIHNLYGKNVNEIDVDLDGNNEKILNSVESITPRNSDLKSRPSIVQRLSVTFGLDFEDSDSDAVHSQKLNSKIMTFKEVAKNKPFLRAIIYTIIFQIFDVFSGTLQISFFATQIISSFNFTNFYSQVFYLVFTLTRLIGSLIGSFLMKKMTRSLQLKISILGCIFCNLLLFGLGFLDFSDSLSNDTNHVNDHKDLIVKITELGTIYLMCIFFNGGLHSIGLTLPDIVPTIYKVELMKYWQLADQLSLVISLLIFPIMANKLKNYVFLIFSIINLMFLIWTKFRFIESKDLDSMTIFKNFEERAGLF